MRMTKRLMDARGSAVVEFIAVAVGIIVPIGYLVVAIASVLGAQAAAQHAVREAGRVFVRDAAVVAGEYRARQAADIAFADRGLAIPDDALTIDCAPTRCLEPGGTVDVGFAWNMPLPWLPAPLESFIAVPIRATGTFAVDEFRPAGE